VWLYYALSLANLNQYATGQAQPGLSVEVLDRVPIAVPPTEREQHKVAECLSTLDELINAESEKLNTLKTHKQGLMQQLFPREGETLPRLRFPEFRDAPEWRTGRASDIAEVHQGYGFPEGEQGKLAGDYPFYKVSDISRTLAAGSSRVDTAANYITHETLQKLKAKVIPTGATIFAKIGEALRLNRRVITTRPCVIDNNTAGVKAIDGQATDLFLFYIWSQVSLEDHAGGVVPAVSKSVIERIPVNYPEVPEQERIASCISSLDDSIAAQSHRIRALETHKRGLMQQLFPAPERVDA
jgi:type I restriction enzyme S subunit